MDCRLQPILPLGREKPAAVVSQPVLCEHLQGLEQIASTHPFEGFMVSPPTVFCDALARERPALPRGLAHWERPTPSMRRKVIIGHQLVKADWNKFRPTNAVSRYQ